MTLLVVVLCLAPPMTPAPTLGTPHLASTRSREPERTAASGRVKRVDRRREEVAIEIDGREEVFGVDDARILDALREGDRIQFEYEQRKGRKVIVQVF
jgi:Cu/Ag efflux protein CusF